MSEYNKDSGYQPPEMGMKWHKFLIYFSLWAGAVLYVISGMLLITGGIYNSSGVSSSMIYAYYGSLKTVDVIFGLLYIALACYLIYTRFQLARFKFGAPSKLTICYVLGVVIAVAYMIGVSSATDLSISDMMDSRTTTQIITSIAMIIINKVYYDKRSHLFVN